MCNPARFSSGSVRAPRARREPPAPTEAELLTGLDVIACCYRESDAKRHAKETLGLDKFKRILALPGALHARHVHLRAVLRAVHVEALRR